MKAFTISAAFGIAFWLFQNVDLITILDKYGFPTLVAVVMFIYFQRQVNLTGKALTDQQALADGYRRETLEEQKSQTEYLRKLLSEARAATACKYESKKDGSIL